MSIRKSVPGGGDGRGFRFSGGGGVGAEGGESPRGGTASPGASGSEGVSVKLRGGEAVIIVDGVALVLLGAALLVRLPGGELEDDLEAVLPHGEEEGVRVEAVVPGRSLRQLAADLVHGGDLAVLPADQEGGEDVPLLPVEEVLGEELADVRAAKVAEEAVLIVGPLKAGDAPAPPAGASPGSGWPPAAPGPPAPPPSAGASCGARCRCRPRCSPWPGCPRSPGYRPGCAGPLRSRPR